MDKMKFNDEYIVWVVALLIIVGALVYSWGNGSREYMESQKCWGPETPMSAATGYYDTAKVDIDYISYLKYIDEKLIKAGTCPAEFTPQSKQCKDKFGVPLVESPDSAKEYCSSVNCTAIMRSDASTPGLRYIPLTSALTQTVPKNLDGTPIPLEIFKMIFPVPCVSPSASASTSSLTLKDDIGDDKVLPQTSTPATASISAPTGPGDSYVLKSSLVPCTCTIHSMGCEKHAGSKPSSSAPGDKDPFPPGKSDQLTAQPQKGLMRPFSSAFSNQGEPTGFLASFAAFG